MKKRRKINAVICLLYGFQILCLCVIIFLLLKKQYFIAGCLAFLIPTVGIFIMMEKDKIASEMGEMRETIFDKIVKKLEDALSEEGTGIKIFMSILGITFIIISVIPVANFVMKYSIKINGQQITAKITSRSIPDYYEGSYKNHNIRLGKNFVTYYIYYEFNNKNYHRSILSTSHSYRDGDIIYIYCMPDNPEKIYVPIERGIHIYAIIFVSPITFIIGFCIIRKFNILKRKKINEGEEI